MDPKLVAALDPGIREWVLRLNGAGFTTTDSGDGATKFKEGRGFESVLDFPHVHMTSTRVDLLEEADRLHALFGDWGTVQATYDPADDSALLSFYPGPSDPC
jgi:hypothetical protein